MDNFDNFRIKTLKQIKIWAWLAAVLPMVSLAGIFFIWVFGDNTLFARAMVFGETSMFAIAVIWWWWAIYVINKLVHQWDKTRDNVGEVLTELRDIKHFVKTGNSVDTDK